MTASPRIRPVDPPYADEVQRAFDVAMKSAPPKHMDVRVPQAQDAQERPLLLFRCVARNPRVLQRMMAGGLLDRGSISVRLRELMILRTTARCGAGYEWGVHVAAFGAKAGWTPAEVAASAGAAEAPWSAEERLVIRLADSLHERSDVDDALWAELAGHFVDEQLVELLMLAGFYHAVSFLVNALRLPPEPGAPPLPAMAHAAPRA